MKWSNLSPLRVAILDDHALIRSGCSARLAREADLAMVAMYASSRQLLAGLRGNPVDVLILDYTLQQGEMDGLNLIRLIRVRYPDIRILVFSSAESPATISLVMRAGVRGFVGKSQDVSEVLSAIRTVASERLVMPKSVSLELGAALLPQESEAQAVDQALLGCSQLSPREREVLRCCLDGMSVSHIAEKFTRSRKTISGQKQSAFRKLGIRCDTELFKIQDQLQAG